MADYAAPKRRALKIIATRGDAVVWSGEIFQETATVGRSPDADLVLDDPLVSWTHARITLEKSGIVFTDSSTNGSFRNGDRVTRVSLGPGGVIAIPPFELELSVESVAQDRATPTSIRDASARPLPTTVPETDVPPSPQTSSDTLALTRTPSIFEPRILVIGVIGRVDGYSHGELQDVMTLAMNEGHRWLIVDLARCVFCDHLGLAVLVNAQVRLTGRKGGLRLVGLNAQLKDALLLLRLDDVLSLAPNEKTAVSELTPLLSK